MKQAKIATALLLVSPLAACGGASKPPASTPPPPSGLCAAEPAQSYVGQKVTQTLGETILKESGAKVLRWGPPRSAWTADYRQDRVNVSYDDASIITKIMCG